MSSPSPFKIAVPEEKLALLRTKLELVTWPDELEDAGSDYGAPLALVKRLTERWTIGYDWRAQEAAINAETMSKDQIEEIIQYMLIEVSMPSHNHVM